jgi:hypothetical protein
VSKKGELYNRNFAVGLYKKHRDGATIRELAMLTNKPVVWVSKRIKIGERFAEPTQEVENDLYASRRMDEIKAEGMLFRRQAD